MNQPLQIKDYSLIGNCRTAALVGKNGSIDWCCMPQFDSPTIFASILDSQNGGSFSITPVNGCECKQQYVPDTNVIETAFTVKEGKCRLLDCFTATDDDQARRQLYPHNEILRVVEGISGTVKLKMTYSPKPNFGRDQAELRNNGSMGVHFSWKGHIFKLLSTLSGEQLLIEKETNTVTGIFNIREGEKVIFSLSNSEQDPAIVPELKETGMERLNDTIEYWQQWLSQCHYNGIYARHVHRSILTLKLLSYAPSGAIVAAPTTSLPEDPGGERNWDYRYCWLRDAAFTTRALIRMGFVDEVHAYMNWILHATQLTRPELQVVYSIYGDNSLDEEVMDHLKGYKDSTPVRVGNGADKQFQLDVYGEVLDAIHLYSDLVEQFDKSKRKFIKGLGKIIIQRWQEPDNGIWEIRSDKVQHTHSKVMCWVGLDRLLKMKDKLKLSEAEVEKFQTAAASIKKEIQSFGYNKTLKSYTCKMEGSEPDASLLTFSLVNYIDANAEEMKGTIAQIHENLAVNNLVYRYKNIKDGIPGNEGAFVLCSFWLAENYALAGNVEMAREIFESVIKYASFTGLLSEEIDPATGELLGNYPQGFSHLGLINAALTINEALEKQKI